MRKLITGVLCLFLLPGSGLWAQSSASTPDQTAEMRQEINQLKKTLAAMEERLAAQEKASQQQKSAQENAPAQAAAQTDTTSVTDLQAQVKDIDQRVTKTERRSALDRINWSGDFRTESNSIFGSMPAYYDGMKLQNLMVRTMWMMSPTSQGGLGMQFNPAMLQQMTPNQFAGFVNGQVTNNYSQYQYFTNNLTFSQLKGSLAQFSPQMQQALQNYLSQVNGVYTPRTSGNNDVLLTNRLRLNFDSQVADNVSVQARLSMYKVFGDSTGVQVFNGQPNTMNIDGTTATVPTGDEIRVERAFFTWNNIAGLPMYLSIGRRPSTSGPPMNFREDEPRGGTPSGALIDYQFDGLTLGYHIGEKMALRACYGLGYESGFGNGQVLETPADRLKDVHFFGGNLDLYTTEKSLVQVTIARAWNVTDGFNGLMVLPNNPLTGEVVAAPVIMRYTPSANLGGINLYGLNLQHRWKQLDMFVSGNLDSLRPNGLTTPFGGLGSDPFETPTNHDGHMIYVGLRYNVAKDDDRTKIGFEFNQGSKYWFNFAQAEDDIIAPKTEARGEVYETYLTHRIRQRFILKVDYQRFNYTWSGSAWDVGAPKRLSSTPVLGFPTYDYANLFTVGLTARF
jgi:hypothetical protein